MKAGALLIAAAIATGVNGKQHARNHVHEAFHMERGLKAVATGTGNSSTELCGCTTIYTTITGEGQLYFPPTSSASSTVVPPSSSSSVAPPASTTAAPATTPESAPASTSTPAPATTSAAVVPTPTWATVYETPGTYTIPATTVTITETCAYGTPVPTTYPPGTYTQPQTVITVTEDVYTYICPLTSSSPPDFIPTATYAPAPTSNSAPASSSSSTSSSGSGGSLGNSGNQWAITYTPYNGDTGACLDQATVASDIAKIAAAGFSTVRIYSTDCSALEFVGAACATSGLKMILGVFISNTGCSAATEQVETIASWAQWSLVELVVFGNEAIFGGYTTAAELTSYMSQWKGTLSAAGYTGPCTTTEPLDVLQANTGTLCDAVDVVGANIHAFFNPNTVASDAGSFVQSQLSIVDSLCPGKSGINLECGWPSAGDCNGVACPGTSQQKTAIDSVMSAVGGQTVLFSYQNDYWKTPGNLNCEQYWGIISSVF